MTMMKFQKFNAVRNLRELLEREDVSSGEGLTDGNLGKAIDIIWEDASSGRPLDRQRLEEIVEFSIDGLSITTEGISNEDLDTLLALARRSQ
jgi:hypothetical protein